MRCIHKILLVLLWLPLPLKAQRIPINANLTPVQMFEKAQMMLSNGYTDKGLGYLQMSAGKHYLPALKFLAQCYLEGKYVPKDFQEAGNILVIAARLGDIDSSNKLAELSKSGRYHAKTWRRGNSPWITPALLTKYLSTTEHEERQVADSMHLCPQPLYL